MYWCVILEVLDCKTSVGFRYSESNAKLVTKQSETGFTVVSTCKTSFCFGGLIVSPVLHLLLISRAPKQLNLINNPLCYFTDQINITEVLLTWCYKCFFIFILFLSCVQLLPQLKFSPEERTRWGMWYLEWVGTLTDYRRLNVITKNMKCVICVRQRRGIQKILWCFDEIPIFL